MEANRIIERSTRSGRVAKRDTLAGCLAREAPGATLGRLVAESDLPYTRTDVIGDVLKRGRIRSITEYEVVVDALVGAQQVGTISSEQAALLSDLIGRYERRRLTRYARPTPTVCQRSTCGMSVHTGESP